MVIVAGNGHNNSPSNLVRGCLYLTPMQISSHQAWVNSRVGCAH